MKPETAERAIQALKDMADLDLTNATAEPDPEVAGVWFVTTPKDKIADGAIVYLAGYGGREEDDYETIETDYSALDPAWHQQKP